VGGAVASAAVLVGCAGALVAQAAGRQISKSQAHAVAAAIDLHRGDLPTFTPQPNSGANTGSAAFVICYGGVPYGQVLADVW